MKELQTSTTTTTPGTFHEILSRRLLLLLLLSAGGTVSFVIALARKKSGTIDDVGCIRPAELAFYIFQSGARNGAIVLREAKVCRRCSHTRLRFRFSAVLNIERAGRVRPYVERMFCNLEISLRYPAFSPMADGRPSRPCRLSTHPRQTRRGFCRNPPLFFQSRERKRDAADCCSLIVWSIILNKEDFKRRAHTPPRADTLQKPVVNLTQISRRRSPISITSRYAAALEMERP